MLRDLLHKIGVQDWEFKFYKEGYAYHECKICSKRRVLQRGIDYGSIDKDWLRGKG